MERKKIVSLGLGALLLFVGISLVQGQVASSRTKVADASAAGLVRVLTPSVLDALKSEQPVPSAKEFQDSISVVISAGNGPEVVETTREAFQNALLAAVPDKWKATTAHQVAAYLNQPAGIVACMPTFFVRQDFVDFDMHQTQYEVPGGKFVKIKFKSPTEASAFRRNLAGRTVTITYGASRN